MSKAAAGKMTAPAAGVTVRVHRQALSDCFLLAFPTRGPRPTYVLVDCGVQLGTAAATAAMKKAAASLAEATGGRIDVLVATREHWDHVAGFQQAKEAFERIEIGQVWASWTMDPNDPEAQRLRERRKVAVQALHEAAQELRQCGEEDSASSLESVLASFGDLGKDGRPAAVQQTMADVLGRGNPPRYLRPGDRPELPGVEGARIYVLGPPGAAPEPAAAAGAAHGAGEAELKAQSFPFDPFYRVPVDLARQDPFFQESYFGAAGQPSEHEMAWRQIENEWLTSASRLTSQLDAVANHTALALAVEPVPGGRVLLFAADAQAESWASEGNSAGWTLPPMPLAPLLQSLLEKSEGQVPAQSPQLSPEEWQDFEKRCTVTPDYVELTVPLAAGKKDPKDTKDRKDSGRKHRP